MFMFSLPWCITWLVLFLSLSVAIVTLNIITIIVFIKNRELRKRSTYLLINLAVVDMLVGGFDGLNAFTWAGVHCNFWKETVSENWLNYQVMIVLEILFPLCSILSITVISAERLHATFWPFRHRVVKNMGLWIINCWYLGVVNAAISWFGSHWTL